MTVPGGVVRNAPTPYYTLTAQRADTVLYLRLASYNGFVAVYVEKKKLYYLL
jgi:hypothetical protein